MAPRPFRVARRERETADTWTLELEPVQGDPLQVAPGQFTMLYAFGVGEVPISVSGEPGGPLVHTVRAVGAVTEAICAAGEETILGVRGPMGNAWPLGTGGDVVVVAGGIGLAPLRGVVYDLVRRRDAFGEAALLYGGRTPADLLYRDELERWREPLQVDVTVDAAEPGWEGKVGFVAKLVGSARFDPAAATAFVCGPEIMMRTSAEALLERGVPAERIFVSMERNMQCGVGLCGHCQLGPTLICRDGPVYRWDEVERLMAVREL
ncbi:MAG TPA: FAD/NAD(P)-binding protein [Gaiellaceae bacterium]|nr:FAD/NAD(P)-binding protein [Gaiellaceae bacterium]